LIFQPKTPRVVLSEEERSKLKEEKEKQDIIEEGKWKGSGDYIPLPIQDYMSIASGGGDNGSRVEGGRGGRGDGGRGVKTRRSDSGGFDWTDLLGWIPNPIEVIINIISEVFDL
jgi:hypothetical protein